MLQWHISSIDELDLSKVGCSDILLQVRGNDVAVDMDDMFRSVHLGVLSQLDPPLISLPECRN